MENNRNNRIDIFPRIPLFKGQSEKDGRWCEGSLLIDKATYEGLPDKLIYRILDCEFGYVMGNDKSDQRPCYQSGLDEEIDPQTLSEYVGLKDDNGKNIFENDILKVTWTTGIDTSQDFFVVVFYRGIFFGMNIATGKLTGTVSNYTSRTLHTKGQIKCEVVGNIYDDTKYVGEYFRNAILNSIKKYREEGFDDRS